MVKTLARGFRWRKMLETGVYATANEIAAAEKINRSYVSRLLRLTLLAPDIVEAVLDGRAQAIIAQDVAPRACRMNGKLRGGCWLVEYRGL